MVLPLIRYGTDDDRREQRRSEQLNAEIHVGRRYVQSGPERHPIERRAVATGNGRKDSSGQLELRHLLEFDGIDEIIFGRKPRRCLPHEKFVLTAVRSRAAMLVRPVDTIASRNSVFMISSKRWMPAAPNAPSAHRLARPRHTALAPSAIALTMSLPRRKPLSTSTGIFPPTASTISGSTSSVAGP